MAAVESKTRLQRGLKLVPAVPSVPPVVRGIKDPTSKGIETLRALPLGLLPLGGGIKDPTSKGIETLILLFRYATTFKVESKTRLQRGLKRLRALPLALGTLPLVESKTRLQRGLKLPLGAPAVIPPAVWNQRPDFKGD